MFRPDKTSKLWYIMIFKIDGYHMQSRRENQWTKIRKVFSVIDHLDHFDHLDHLQTLDWQKLGSLEKEMIRNTCTFCSGHLPLQGMGVDFNTGRWWTGCIFCFACQTSGRGLFFQCFQPVRKQLHTSFQKQATQETQSGSSYDIVIQLLQIVTAKTCNCVRQHIHNALCPAPRYLYLWQGQGGVRKMLHSHQEVTRLGHLHSQSRVNTGWNKRPKKSFHKVWIWKYSNWEKLSTLHLIKLSGARVDKSDQMIPLIWSFPPKHLYQFHKCIIMLTKS